MPCPHCGAEAGSALACAKCGRLLDPAGDLSPFALLGLTERFAIDPTDLRKRVLREGRLVHPDFFVAAPAAERELAERNSARLNRAHELLADDWQRADWLVSARGGPAENEARAMPPAFLAEVLEWNELLEEARGAPLDPALPARLEALARTLAEQRARAMAALFARLEPLPERGSPALAEARAQLNAIRYVDRALAEIVALGLAHASLR
jgi:molecular chaperone HscB